MKNLLSNYSRWKVGAALFIAAFTSQLLILTPSASAVTLSETMVRLNRLDKSQATTGTVCAEPSVVGDSEGKVLLTFPAGFTVGASWNTDTSTTTGWPTGGTAWPSIQATGSGSGQTVTFTSGDLTSSSTLYCFNWTNAALTNNSTIGQYAITVATQTSGGGALESSTATTDIVDTNCGSGTQACDQIQVSASVNQTFTFSLSATTASLGALSISSPTASSAINGSVSTNAKNGWQMWGADLGGANAGLHSTSAGYTIAYSPSAGASASTLSNGSEGENLGAGNHTGTCNGTVSYGSGYDDTASTAYKGGGLDGTMRTIASADNTANACAIPLTVNASISGTTPAASDYSGAITVVAAGLF